MQSLDVHNSLPFLRQNRIGVGGDYKGIRARVAGAVGKLSRRCTRINADLKKTGCECETFHLRASVSIVADFLSSLL
jgi:hypothetical protein